MNICQHGLKDWKCTTCCLTDLHATVGHLASSLLPGTARPYRAPTLTPEQREDADYRARQERLERVDIAPGDCPDPYRLDVSELLTDVLIVADHLAEQVCAEAEQSLRVWAGAWSWDLPSLHRHASSHMADPRPYLDLLILLLGEVQDERPDLVSETLLQAQRLLDRAAPMLGLIIDGQRLPQDCPWCGQDDWRVRMLRERDLTRRPYVVCESDRCAPGEANVGRWHRNRPAWDLLTEGEWLAKCVEAVDASRLCRCGAPLPLTGRRGRPAGYCSEECRREADAERKREERAA